MSLLSWLLVTLAGLSLAIMVVSLTIANRAAREARSTIFPVVREEETVRAQRARIATSVTGVVASILAGAFFLSGQLPSPGLAPQSAPADALIVAVSPTATTAPQAEPLQTSLVPGDDQITPTSSQAVSTGGTPLPPVPPTPLLPTLAPTAVPSSTPTPLPPSPTSSGTPAPAPASVQMGPISFAARITGRREPLNPTTVFSDTVNRVYATFFYSGMRNGLEWAQVWYFDDVEFSRNEETWTWGSTDRSYVFTKLVGAGDYRLELYVNDELQSSGEFAVLGPVAIGGPKTPEDPETPEGLETPGRAENPDGLETPRSP